MVTGGRVTPLPDALNRGERGYESPLARVPAPLRSRSWSGGWSPGPLTESWEAFPLQRVRNRAKKVPPALPAGSVDRGRPFQNLRAEPRSMAPADFPAPRAVPPLAHRLVVLPRSSLRDVQGEQPPRRFRSSFALGTATGSCRRPSPRATSASLGSGLCRFPIVDRCDGRIDTHQRKPRVELSPVRVPIPQWARARRGSGGASPNSAPLP